MCAVDSRGDGGTGGANNHYTTTFPGVHQENQASVVGSSVCHGHSRSSSNCGSSLADPMIIIMSATKISMHTQLCCIIGSANLVIQPDVRFS